MSKIPLIKLADGNLIPQIGLGLWQITDEVKFKDSFKAAVSAGYRHFDSAQAYGNEQFLGDAVRRSCEDNKLKRSDFFITTKIAVQNFGDKKSIDSVKKSLQKLGMEYVDLLLLHFPVPVLRKKTWQAAEEMQSLGLARSIGVSNFTISHLKHLEGYAKQLPVVNQVEMHIFLQQTELNNYCKQQNIVIEAYSPLAHAKEMNNRIINSLAAKHNIGYAQIMLRWALQQDVVILPKSVTPQRIRENLTSLDFRLDASDMELLKNEDRNLHTCWNPELVP